MSDQHRSQSFHCSALSVIVLIAITFLSVCSAETEETGAAENWPVSLGDKSGSQYSRLDQINGNNVKDLNVAWTYRSGDADTVKNSQIQANPLVIDGTLYATSPRLKVIALDASTGKQRWVFNPFPDTAGIATWLNVNRGVTYWENREDKRILFTAGPVLYALDAQTGKPVQTFGDKGTVSLKKGLDGRAEDLYVVATSPGIIYKDLIIIGSRVSEGTDAAPGDIRAFNVRTGELEWIFHTIPRPGEFGYHTWEDPDAWQQIGGANNWAGMALDEQRGMVYVPTGSASPDFYGGNRKGSNLFANTLLALDAATGERIWHFQTIHHDLWDRDLPSPPTLVTVNHDGRKIDAVAQTTKTGYLYLFERETGDPLFPVEEMQVPVDSKLEGEDVWPTQPVPTIPKPFVRQQMTEGNINPYVSEAVRQDLKHQLGNLKSDHMFAPPSLQGTLMFPGFDGGAEWGGSAFDPETGLLYTNSNEVPWIMTMVPAGKQTDSNSLPNALAMGSRLYMNYCISCHGPDRKGGGNNPSLIDIGDRYTQKELLDVIDSGRRMMPGFSHLPENQKKAIVNYLIDEVQYEIDLNSDKKEISGDPDPSTPYVMTGYKKFQTPAGYPANSPPWGTLNAINLNTGEYAWRIPLGEYPELKAKDVPPTGTENYGGSVVTAGGLVFIAATLDKKFRAFDKLTGEQLWDYDLPAAGFATPGTYMVDGKQYLVIACGGGKLGTRSGDFYIAFALSD